MRHALRRLCREETGATIVEMAVVAPVLFLLLFAVVEFGIATFRWSAANEGARQGARLMMVRSTASGHALAKGALQDSIRARLGDRLLVVDSLEWRKANGSAGANTEGDYVRVVVSYPSLRITRLFPAMRPSGAAESVIVY